MCQHNNQAEPGVMREVSSEIGYRLIGHGVYTIPEAARLTRIAAPRIRRWLRGHEHRIGGELRRSPAMIEPTFGLIDGMVAISFLDLVEIRFINAFVEQGVTWAYLRKAHERAVEIVGHSGHSPPGRSRPTAAGFSPKLWEPAGLARRLMVASASWVFGR
jgi:hypothetical protein